MLFERFNMPPPATENNQIHVLAKLPVDCGLVAVDRRHTQFKAYALVRSMLKNSTKVNALMEAIKRAQHEPGAFIVLENSSGMGITQTAFNLMARDGIDVFYVVCPPTDWTQHEDSVHSTFRDRSLTFDCWEQMDASRMIDASLLEINWIPSLYTFAFVHALLTNTNRFMAIQWLDRVKLDQLIWKRKEKGGRSLVFFLDESPFHDEFKPERSENYLRFMRNTFRLLELVEILGSMSESAGQLMIKGLISRPHSAISFWGIVPTGSREIY